MSAFIGDMDVRLIHDDTGGLWQLLSVFGYQSDCANTTIMVEIGTQSDFYSVPRVPLVYDMLGNRFRRSGLVHDSLYKSRLVSREMCDQILREMLLVEGAAHYEAEEFYLAVRQFGASHY